MKRLEIRKKKIFRIVHTKLRPPAVYYSIKKHIPLEIQKELIRANSQMRIAEKKDERDVANKIFQAMS